MPVKHVRMCNTRQLQGICDRLESPSIWGSEKNDNMTQRFYDKMLRILVTQLEHNQWHFVSFSLIYCSVFSWKKNPNWIVHFGIFLPFLCQYLCVYFFVWDQNVSEYTDALNWIVSPGTADIVFVVSFNTCWNTIFHHVCSFMLFCAASVSEHVLGSSSLQV